MAKQTVTRQSLKDQIKTILIDRIIGGDLGPGERIKELQVAQEFGTSQAPVREAIRCLETLGYVQHVPHVGAMVRGFNKKEVEEAYQVREALEVHAVGLISDNTDRLVTALETQLTHMKAAAESHNIRMFIDADNQFHRLIVDACRNATLLDMWESLKMQLQVIATLVKASMPLDVIYDLHPPIVNALKTEGQIQATRLLKGHYKVLTDYWQNRK